MNILCDKCKKEFVPSKEQLEFISSARKKGMKFIMVKCPLCSFSYPLNPMTLNLPTSEKEHNGDGLKCPKETCSGIISYIDDEPPFWGCGECGSVWFKKEDLYCDIKNIIVKYPYRAFAYEILDDEYCPVSSEKIPISYDEKVRSEWDNK
ncbi:hypothetical protein B6B36_00165 [Salmonella enterica]|uniref:Uncharacterized protein n=1 Tax=Salmonella enterica I TaxID=59201 RepID=A0A7T8FG05_SALET|nr:hypothetical protein N898_13000 [Salmonella enterica subsp. arizonae serovar 62:z36:- str. RKS2983]EAO6001650.1 hypothetical protein [Salmonella enterica subsp. arizonae serovar 62:z36:-]EAX3726477.1 hypothetical protein [Salmonella enterica]EBP3773651.1 hypothetical protein [Salmonella enterica subsp. arizonae]ECG1413868.1 hypothetical protein [Salmonella enterica subsp. arizonae str. CFSAN000560]EJQ7237775.1 hypothetical protein [Salmonella enterica subsp. enterica]KSB75827.1 hypothetica